jgi:hypothetical protein
MKLPTKCPLELQVLFNYLLFSLDYFMVKFSQGEDKAPNVFHNDVQFLSLCGIQSIQGQFLGETRGVSIRQIALQKNGEEIILK